MRKLLLLAALAGVSVAAQAQVAIVGGRVITNNGAPIENGVVITTANGQVASIGPAGTPVPAGMRVIDATGKWVTPGIVVGISQLGMADVSGVRESNDLRAATAPESAALEANVTFNPDEVTIPVTRIEGVTSAVVAPDPGRTIFAGQGMLISLAQGQTQPIRPRAFQYVQYGEQGASIAGGSRPAAWAELTHALEEAKRILSGKPPERDQTRDPRITPEDAEALTLVLRSAQPLLVNVDRASDIRQVLKLKTMYPGIRLVLVSANEGWMVADEIARAGVPVITLGMTNLPTSFQSAGATMSNVGRMVAAGVKVALGTPDLDGSFQPRLLPQYAGNMVAQARLPGGVGLTWDQAFATISRAPAEIFGMQSGVLRSDAPADIVIWSGDPLELTTHAEHVLIAGAEQPMESRQTKLARRYLPGRDRTQLPEEYSR